MSRRERMRENTREEIKAIARSQMATMGAALLSLNSIAREMEMTTPALYRYFASREDLITALAQDALNAFVEALETRIAVFPADAYADRLFAAMLEYRAWAVAHPIEYQLLAGDPIPDYHLSQEIWIGIGTRLFGLFLELLQGAYEAGVMQPQAYEQELPADLKVLIPFPYGDGKFFAPIVAYQGASGWYRMHGIIMLETCHHFDTVVSNPTAFYRHEILHHLRMGGFEPTIA